MPLEIERKFLVNDQWKNVDKGEGVLYEQGYLMMEPGKIVRVRLAAEQGFLTIKGKTTNLSRPEFDYEIPKEDAQTLLDQFCISKLSKKRYKIAHQGHVWEVDEFLGENAGLIVAEIELENEDEHFESPEWVDEEVSHEKKYTNASLSIHAFKEWE